MAISGTGAATNTAQPGSCGQVSEGIGCIAISGTGPALNNDGGECGISSYGTGVGISCVAISVLGYASNSGSSAVDLAQVLP
ncbi:MAG: hypothetical protein ACYDDF_05015 [Thermoplasmatota archaeon]